MSSILPENVTLKIPQVRCNVCSDTFMSKTKLFIHINETGHALAEPVSDSQKSRQKGKKK